MTVRTYLRKEEMNRKTSHLKGRKSSEKFQVGDKVILQETTERKRQWLERTLSHIRRWLSYQTLLLFIFHLSFLLGFDVCLAMTAESIFLPFQTFYGKKNRTVQYLYLFISFRIKVGVYRFLFISVVFTLFYREKVFSFHS